MQSIHKYWNDFIHESTSLRIYKILCILAMLLLSCTATIETKVVNNWSSFNLSEVCLEKIDNVQLIDVFTRNYYINLKPDGRTYLYNQVLAYADSINAFSSCEGRESYSGAKLIIDTLLLRSLNPYGTKSHNGSDGYIFTYSQSYKFIANAKYRITKPEGQIQLETNYSHKQMNSNKEEFDRALKAIVNEINKAIKKKWANNR